MGAILRGQHPTADAVRKALRRDVPTVGGAWGYRVGPPTRAVCGPSIAVQFEDLPFQSADVERAKELRDTLIAAGWEVRPMREGSVIMYVDSIGKGSRK